MKLFVIITAGGTGNRMKSNIPKQFLVLGKMPILMHSVLRFYDYNPDMSIILSLPKDYVKLWEDLCVKYDFKIKHKIVEGGKTRFHSIKNALEAINEDGFVAVHDGVRPLVSIETIRHAFETAKKRGNASASSDIVFSLRKITKSGNISVNRNEFKEIQTPQVFEIKKLKEAYETEYKPEFTDDASVFENAGNEIYLTQGNKENIKITTKEDLIIAEALLNRIF